ncbi:unnamed protein product [Haemonchus placei]|uniref:Uncharacterized protein n=1 Tax=Haemonchus placei TaxID=6290 RepID=A0A0N4W4H3_HAEPC|nr:unnamed protein product [Haemonchus placei]
MSRQMGAVRRQDPLTQDRGIIIRVSLLEKTEGDETAEDEDESFKQSCRSQTPSIVVGIKVVTQYSTTAPEEERNRTGYGFRMNAIKFVSY